MPTNSDVVAQSLESTHNEHITLLSTTKCSYHLRVFEYESFPYSLLTEMLEKYCSQYCLYYETLDKFGKGCRPHYHAYIETQHKKTIQNNLSVLFPSSLGHGKIKSFVQTTTVDLSNLRYCMKQGQLSISNMDKTLLSYLSAFSYSPNSKRKSREFRKWKDALEEFEEKFGTASCLSKDYSRNDVLNFAIKSYKTIGPYTEDHVYKLCNLLLQHSRFEDSHVKDFNCRVKQKYNLCF